MSVSLQQSVSMQVGMKMLGVAGAGDVELGANLASHKLPLLTINGCYNVQELKKGRYSIISHGCCDSVGAPVVIKTYDRPSMVPKKQKMATREAIVLKYLNAQEVPNITHMWSAYASQDKFHIIMEYCEGGNLLDHLKAAGGPIPEQQLAAMIAGPLLRTLAAMHAAGVTHRDIKLENIFLDGQGNPKLGDFDLAVFHHESPARAPVGTIFYMAPEVLLLASYKGNPLEVTMQSRVSEKMDIWSLGVCLFELAAGYKPFQGVSYEGIASAVLQHAIADLPSHISPECRSFISAALTYDPVQRPSAAQLLNHPWIQHSQEHHPSAFRSDSAGSLLDTCGALFGKLQQEQGVTWCASKRAAVCGLQQQHQEQQHASAGGCSSSCFDSLTHSSHNCCSITGSSYSSSSPALKSSRDLHYGGPVGLAATVAAGGDYGSPSGAVAAPVWAPQLDPLQQLQQQHQHPPASALSPLTAQAVFSGLRVRSSLGTAGDWSTPDSSVGCSPRSMLLRMGLSSSGVLARQLMPWATAGSSMLGLGYNPHMNQSAGVGDGGSPGPQQQQSAEAPGSKAVLQNSSAEQQQGKVPQVVSSTLGGGQQQQSQGSKTAGITGTNGAVHNGGNAQPQSAASSKHVRSSSASSTSSSTGAVSGSSAGAVPPRQQQQTAAAAPMPRSSSSRGSSQSSAEAATATAPSAGTAGTLSPLALAVAAAVAEHNKRQPRMWTPFALRVHQMRVAQVLLAERQRQAALHQPTPPPPAQPLVPQQGEPVALPDHNGTHQQQQQKAAGEVAAASRQQQQHVETPEAAAAAAAAPAAEDRTDSALAGSARGCDKATAQQQESAAAAAAAGVGVGGVGVGVDRSSSPAGADAMVRPLVHQMQQQLSVGSPGAGSSSSSMSARNNSSKPPKQPKKKGFLSCFAPRAHE